MNKFRLLRADEIECRVSQIYDWGLTLLLYKTARTDANLLDETVGFDRWQNDFKVIDGVLYGGIGIELNDGAWVWKWDAGVESQTEAEKGRASDAFKRAGFKLGIGRELYTSPKITIFAKDCHIKEGRNGKLACYDNFAVGAIEYNDAQEISRLIICLDDVAVFEWEKDRPATKHTPAPKTPKTALKTPYETDRNGTKYYADDTAGDDGPFCSDCGARISDKVKAFSVKKYGRALCMDCQKNEG